MASLLQFVLLGASALGNRAAQTNECATVVENMHRSGNDFDFARLSLASGKSLPFDAGKYAMCMNLNSTFSKWNGTRYFLVKMDGTFTAKPDVQSIPLQVGFCVPASCDHSGVIDLVKSPTVVGLFVPELGPNLALLQVSNVTATSPQLDLQGFFESDGAGLAALTVGFLVLIVLVSSLLSLSVLHHNQRQPRIFQAFSLFGKSGTIKKLMEMPPHKPTDSLNGLRVLSMAWIILGHTFTMPQGGSGFANEEGVKTTPLNSDNAGQNPLLGFFGFGAQSGIGTFFFLSGFLLSYLTLKELREGKVKVLGVISLRYLRLTPSLTLTALVYYKIWAYLGFGPFAVSLQDHIKRLCHGSWGYETIDIMNIVPFDSKKVCMGWTWYIGDDMIFFFISVLILIVYHWRRWLGWLIVLVLTILSVCVTMWLVFGHQLYIYMFHDDHKGFSFWGPAPYLSRVWADMVISKPYTLVPAYFVGLMAVWVLDDLEQRGITRERRPRTASATMFARAGAAFAGALLIFLTFIPCTDFGDNKNNWGSLVSALYLGFSRPVWAMCWAAIILLCYYDFLPLVNSFLAHRFWAPLARLTYGAYLVHPLVIKLAAGRSLQFYTFNGWDLAYRFAGNAIMAYSGSFLLWILAERPCMTLLAPLRKLRNETADCGSSSSNSTWLPPPPSLSANLTPNRTDCFTFGA